jgi:hypothetical protein
VIVVATKKNRYQKCKLTVRREEYSECQVNSSVLVLLSLSLSPLCSCSCSCSCFFPQKGLTSFTSTTHKHSLFFAMTEQTIQHPELDIIPYCSILESSDTDVESRARAIETLWDYSCQHRKWFFSQKQKKTFVQSGSHSFRGEQRIMQLRSVNWH